MSETGNTRSAGLRGRPVGRRDILKVGATSAVMPVVLGPSALTEKRRVTDAAGDKELPAGPFSVGYWSGDPDTALANARTLAAGDSRFAKHGARIEMLGMSPGADGQATLQSLAIDITMQPVNYRAWRYENTAVQNVSSPSSFSVPVDDKRGLTFTIESLAGRLTGVPQADTFRLSLGKEKTVAKLREGYYVIAVGAQGRSLRLNWAGYELRGDGTGQSMILTRNGQPVTDVPYVLFSVTHNSGTRHV